MKRKATIRMTGISWLLIFVFLLTTFPVFAQFAGGSGSQQDPYRVATAEHLNNVRNYLDSWFIQIADINLDVKPWNQGEGWEPIGISSKYDVFDSPFEGTYNGNGHMISGLYINRPDARLQGLFGYLDGTIRNLNLVDSNIKGGWETGALVGQNSGTINNCFSTGDVTGTNDTGGLVGCVAEGTVSNCYFKGNVFGERCVGGVVGNAEFCAIDSCFSTGNVSGKGCIGGLAGYLYVTDACNCYFMGKVVGEYSTGGFVGMHYKATIDSCYSTSDVSGDNCVGGLVGLNLLSYINNSYSIGDVFGKDDTGGLVGYNERGSINNCYSIGNVSGDESTGGLVGASGGWIFGCFSSGKTTGRTSVGGLVGNNFNEIINCYSTGDVTGEKMTGGLVGFNNFVVYEESYNEETDNMIEWDLCGTIENSYSIVNVLGGEDTGGLVGLFEGIVGCCYSVGSVIGKRTQVALWAEASILMPKSVIAIGMSTNPIRNRVLAAMGVAQVKWCTLTVTILTKIGTGKFGCLILEARKMEDIRI